MTVLAVIPVEHAPEPVTVTITPSSKGSDADLMRVSPASETETSPQLESRTVNMLLLSPASMGPEIEVALPKITPTEAKRKTKASTMGAMVCWKKNNTIKI